MTPLIDIQRIESDGYSYCVRAPGAPAQEGGSAFGSLAQCLFDAGLVLGHYFTRVELHCEGVQIGACATDLLRRDPGAVADRIAQHRQPA